MTRLARHYCLVDPDDCLPPHGLDLQPGGRDALRVEALTEAFATAGFDPAMPCLVGYPLDGKIQLLSGTHRHVAAKRAGIMLPVTMLLRSVVQAAWGTPAWDTLIEDIPVRDLELAPVQDPVPPPGIDEQVDLSRGYDP